MADLSNLLAFRQKSIDTRNEAWKGWLQGWLTRRDFAGLAMNLVHFAAEDYLIVGAIHARASKDFDRANETWRLARLVHECLVAAVAARAELAPGDCARPDAADLRAAYFLNLQFCLLLAGDRARLRDVGDCYGKPFTIMREEGERAADPIAAEGRLQFAGWTGDLAVVEQLAGPLAAHYARFKIDPVYTQLWRAVAARDIVLLNQLLPTAEAAYKKAGRRKNRDIWGGDKLTNENMFDVYTTSVLKIARDVGMTWTYPSDYAREIWPEQVIAHWQA